LTEDKKVVSGHSAWFDESVINRQTVIEGDKYVRHTAGGISTEETP